jgi:hypothetical protein
MSGRLAAFSSSIRAKLHPRPYQYELSPLDGCELLLVQNYFYIARYALAVVAWNSEAEGAAQLRALRSRIAHACWAMPMIREVGLYAIFCGPCTEWSRQVDSMSADSTGLHRVIIQAVHLVDLDQGVHKLSSSRWNLSEIAGEPDAEHLEIRFGGVEKIAPSIISLVRQSARQHSI